MSTAFQLGRRLTWAFAFLFALAATASAQDWIRTGTGLGMEKVRLAAADFKPATQDAKNTDLLKAFNDTLSNDLDNAGIFDLVSKSFHPLQTPGQPSEVNFSAWSSPPPNAAMLAFGNLGAAGDKVNVQGWLYDLKNQASPQVLGKQYSDSPPRTARSHDRTQIRRRNHLSPRRRHPRHRRNQDLLCQRPQRPQRNLDDGLRRQQPDPTHAPGQHFALAPYLARWLAPGFQFGGQKRLGNHDVLLRPQPHGLVPARSAA